MDPIDEPVPTDTQSIPVDWHAMQHPTLPNDPGLPVPVERHISHGHQHDLRPAWSRVEVLRAVVALNVGVLAFGVVALGVAIVLGVF